MQDNKYWFVSEFYKPIDNATGYIITKIVEEFSQSHKANVITVGKYDDNDDNISVYRVNDVKADKNKLNERLKKVVLVSIRLAWQILKRVKRGDTVVTVTNPALILLFVALISRIKKIKVVIIVHDVFPENLLVAGMSNENDIKYKLSKKIFNWAYRSANLLVTCGFDMENIIRKKVNNKVPVTTIQNFANTSNIYSVAKKDNKILNELGIVDKFVVLFTGNIGRMQDIPNLLSAAEILQDDDTIAFLFIGDGAMDNLIHDYIEKSSIKNVYKLGYMRQTESLSFLNAGDIGIASLLPNIMGVGVPSKSYSYLAAGTPIIAVMDSDTEIASMVEKHNVGWIVPAGNSELLAKTISDIKNNIEDVNIKAQNSFKLSQGEYSEKLLKQRFVKAIIK